MQFEGRVTSYDLERCKYVVDNKVTVEAGHLFAKTNIITMPALNSWVYFMKAHLFENTIVLDAESDVNIESSLPTYQTKPCQPFVNLIRAHNLNFFDVKDLENKIETIEKKNVFMEMFLKRNVSVKDLVYKSLQYLAPKLNYESLFDESKLNSYKIMTPNDHKFEEGAREIDCKVYWSHGVQAFKNKSCLIGLLRVSLEKGFIILQDASYLIVCEITHDNRAEYSLKMSQLLNNLVLVQNYYIFTERTSKNPMIHYIFVNIRDVHLLETLNKEIQPKSGASSSKQTTVTLIVKYRCTNSVKDKYINCWINCEVKTDNCDYFRECFFILSGNQFPKYPLMNPDDVYTLSSRLDFFATAMSNFKSKKTFTLDNITYPVFYVPADAKLTLISGVKNEQVNKISNEFSFISIPEANEVIEINKWKHEEAKNAKQKCRTDLLTFHAVIKKRRTVSPNKYNKAKRSPNKCFGVRGTEVHQIIFRPDPSDEITRDKATKLEEQQKHFKAYAGQDMTLAEQYYRENLTAKPQKVEEISLYLHNWEELQLPLGLVHGMRVAVRNVMNPPGTNYLKPTFVTKIEPLEYCPKQDFQTTFEFENNSDWGPSNVLSDSNYIPPNILCWAPALTMHFTAFSMKFRCGACREIVTTWPNLCCLAEGQHRPVLDMVFALRCRDAKGIFDVVSREENVLISLLGLRKDQWGLWKMNFETVRWWTMNPVEWKIEQETNEDASRTSDEDNFAEMATNYVVTFNKQGCHPFDLKCRKLEKNENDFNNNQKWYLVEAKPSNTESGLNNIYYLS